MIQSRGYKSRKGDSMRSFRIRKEVEEQVKEGLREIEKLKVANRE